METETIVYYHPIQEAAYKNTAAKRHWWQEARLRAQMLPGTETAGFFTLADCPVPPFYYKK